MKYYFLLSLILLIKCTYLVSSILLKPKVVGGLMGQIRQFPHSGFLKVMCLKHKNVAWSCGTSIVNQRILLTAGHCVETCGVRDRLSVSTGYVNRGQGVASSVHSFYLHERFATYGIINDIALLRLKTDLKFSPEVQRVALMKKPPYFEKAQVAGWGFVKEIDSTEGTEDLHYIDQYVWLNGRCKRKLMGLKKGTFCASSGVETSYVSVVRIIHAHEEYRTNSFGFDIALMGLKTKLIFGTDVRRVALMKRPPRFVTAQVAGWGYNKENPGKNAQIIHYMDQHIWTWAKCRKLNKKIPAGTFCGKSKKSSYATGGDSGSALVVRGYIQIGIVSYKMPHISRSLVVYTDTGFFYEWIKKNSKKLYCVIEKA